MENRAKKFEKKISGDVRKLLYDAQKKSMVRQEAEHTEALVKIELQIKELAQGEPIIHLPYYIIFGKEIYRLRRKHTDETLADEACIRYVKWRARGLNQNILNSILALYSLRCIVCDPFTLDLSLLDGPDCLI